MAIADRYERDPVPLHADRSILTLWTADPITARRADAAGVDRIGVDLERQGKADRQRGLGTWISSHRAEDLSALRLSRARLFARVDPVQPEVERLLELGVEVLMLPMVASAAEADAFVRAVDGRARVVLLVECVQAVAALRELVRVPGVDEVHLGLNDLALSLGLRNRWLVMAGDIPRRAAAIAGEAGLTFGLGGIGRAGDDQLPIAADLVYAEHARVGATAALLSRSFSGGDMAHEVARARRRLADWRTAPSAALERAHAELARQAERVACF